MLLLETVKAKYYLIPLQVLPYSGEVLFYSTAVGQVQKPCQCSGDVVPFSQAVCVLLTHSNGIYPFNGASYLFQGKAQVILLSGVGSFSSLGVVPVVL